MPESESAEQAKLAAEAKWVAYNQKMATLFAERDTFPMDTPKRDAAVQKIMALWVAKG